MRHQLRRFRRGCRRLYWLSSLMGGVWKAIPYMMRARRNADAPAVGVYGGFHFHFRARDLMALDEVLVRREYAPLSSILERAAHPLVLDLGSNIGLFSLWTLAINPSADVYAVEPSPGTYQILRKNADEVALAGMRLQTIRAAAWGDSCAQKFDANGDSMGHRIGNDGGCVVPGLTFSDLLDKVDSDRRVDLMKIDIEGAEESFLCGSSEALNRVDNVVIELHRRYCNTDRVREQLSSVFPQFQVLSGRQSLKPMLHYFR